MLTYQRRKETLQLDVKLVQTTPNAIKAWHSSLLEASRHTLDAPCHLAPAISSNQNNDIFPTNNHHIQSFGSMEEDFLTSMSRI